MRAKPYDTSGAKRRLRLPTFAYERAAETGEGSP